MYTPGKKVLALVGAGVLAVAGVTAGVLTTKDNNTNATSTEVLTCAHPCQGDSLEVVKTQFDNPAQAASLITNAKANLCKTTITGVYYFAHSTAANPLKGFWYTALSQLTLAQSLSPEKSVYDDAGDGGLVLTTIPGKKYCMSPGKYADGSWEHAFMIYNQELVNLQNDQSSNPTIKVNAANQNWIQCATEGGHCSFTGTKSVRYGLNDTWTTSRNFSDGVDCNNTVFGDPAVGVNKVCQYQ